MARIYQTKAKKSLTSQCEKYLSFSTLRVCVGIDPFCGNTDVAVCGIIIALGAAPHCT
jgi:hypothetical protein